MSEYCGIAAGSKHQWIETGQAKEIHLSESDEHFSLQMCTQCGECRKVKYE